jgi:alpha-ribazole phosphatase
VPGLRERHFGRWEGMSLEEIFDSYPGEFGNWARDPLGFSPVGGESTLEVRDRAVSALEDILSRHNGGAIAVVAHGGVNRVVLCHVLGIPLENIFLIEQDHACVNIIEFGDGRRLVRLLNGVCPGR